MRRFFLSVIAFFVLLSCEKILPVEFPVRGSGAALTAVKPAAAGVLDFSGQAKLNYKFEKAPSVSAPASLEIEYSFSAALSEETKKNYRLVFESANDTWLLPLDLSFLGIESVPAGAVFHYAIPVRHPFPPEFNFALSGPEIKKNREIPRFNIHSLEFGERWYGFYTEGDRHFFVSPFVYLRAEKSPDYVIDPPVEQGLPELSLVFPVGENAGYYVTAEGRRFETAASGLYLPAGLISAKPGPISISSPHIPEFQLRYRAPVLFPAPLTADPGLILDWPPERWRDSRYEVFRWERFPSLLIFDTANYTVQDRLFKRLAFFTEKAGFRGRLAADSEIAALHGWNAHDYRAEDLARFFETARKDNFPLLDEERELERILLNAGIIRRASDGAITDGAGGVISVSRESADYLRSLFMVHEAFHGLFFIDEDFREFCRGRWLALNRQAKDFILSFFDYQRYDTGDEYLMINEFMAHILQQPAFRAGAYFGETLPRRLESSPWRAGVLGGKDQAANSWPHFAAAFTREAEALSAYVNRRWGLAAGRVRTVF